MRVNWPCRDEVQFLQRAEDLQWEQNKDKGPMQSNSLLRQLAQVL
jgi:hypothetical protein